MKAQILKSVRLNYTFIGFGINSTQLSSSMDGIILGFKEGCISVRSKYFEGQEKVILPPGVCEITFHDVPEKA